MFTRKTYEARLDAIARIVFVLAILYGSVLYVLHGLAARPFSLSAGLCYFVVAGSSVALLLSPRHRTSLLIVAASSGVVLLAVETALELHRVRENAAWLAMVTERTGTDPVSNIFSLAELRKVGIDAVGPRCPFMSSSGEDKSLLPLGGWPFRHTLLGNELGYKAVYVADRYGFNNPDDVHERLSDEPAVVVLGDSFAHGVAVRPDANAAAVLRRRGYAVLNLGCTGNGPLAALASYREYGHRHAPDVVVWFYFEANDLSDLGWESETLLVRYFEPGFTQQLATRSGEIVRFLDRLPTSEQPSRTSPVRVALVENLRTIVATVAVDQRGRVELLRRVAVELQHSIVRDGARLLVVYLPNPDALAGATRRDTCRLNAMNCKSDIFQLFDELSIPILDFEQVLARLDDPLSVFPYHTARAARGHYTEEGYALLGNAIADELARPDGSLGHLTQSRHAIRNGKAITAP